MALCVCVCACVWGGGGGEWGMGKGHGKAKGETRGGEGGGFTTVAINWLSRKRCVDRVCARACVCVCVRLCKNMIQLCVPPYLSIHMFGSFEASSKIEY